MKLKFIPHTLLLAVGLIATSTLLGMHHNQTEFDQELIDVAKEGHPGKIAFLLNLGANKDTTDKYGSTPLHYAAANGHTRAVITLLDRGASVNTTSNDGSTPLHSAITSCTYYSSNTRDWLGIFPKKRASLANTIYTLASAGASLDVLNNQLQTPRDLAQQAGLTGLVSLMEGARATAGYRPHVTRRTTPDISTYRPPRQQ